MALTETVLEEQKEETRPVELPLTDVNLGRQEPEQACQVAAETQIANVKSILDEEIKQDLPIEPEVLMVRELLSQADQPAED